MRAPARGYTTEPMFWGVSMIGNMQGNNPVAAARVLNYLASPEGYELTAVGVKDVDYQGEGDAIELLPDVRNMASPPRPATQAPTHWHRRS